MTYRLNKLLFVGTFKSILKKNIFSLPMSTLTHTYQDVNDPIIVTSFLHKKTSTWSYIVYENESKEGVIIDSALDFDYSTGNYHFDFANIILNFIKTNNLSIKYIIETHVHADHLTAAPYLQEQLTLQGALNVIPSYCIGNHINTVQETFGELFNLDAKQCKKDGSQFGQLIHNDDILLAKLVKSIKHFIK